MTNRSLRGGLERAQGSDNARGKPLKGPDKVKAVKAGGGALLPFNPGQILTIAPRLNFSRGLLPLPTLTGFSKFTLVLGFHAEAPWLRSCRASGRWVPRAGDMQWFLLHGANHIRNNPKPLRPQVCCRLVLMCFATGAGGDQPQAEHPSLGPVKWSTGHPQRQPLCPWFVKKSSL